MNLFRRLVLNKDVAPRTFLTSGFTVIPESETVEEENWPWYTPTSFYPVQIGEVLVERYQVLYKLGYGSTCTMWMCRDLRRNKYVCVKSIVCDYKESVKREMRAYKALSTHGKWSQSLGMVSVREVLDQFELQKGRDRYRFLVHEPLGISIAVLLELSDEVIVAGFVTLLLKWILHALDFIHTAGIVHTDLQENNFLLKIYDKKVLKEAEKEEIEHPSARKTTAHGTTIFETRPYHGSWTRWFGIGSFPVLCDFGEARMGKESYNELVQPLQYRAPEVFLGLPWNQSVDIWNLGCFVWRMMCGRHIFSRTGTPDELSADRQQIGWMVTLLGPAPTDILTAAGPRALEYFNEDGTPITEVPKETMETLLASSLKLADQTQEEAECAGFLAFARRTLRWRPEERPTAAELLKDPWFKLKR